MIGRKKKKPEVLLIIGYLTKVHPAKLSTKKRKKKEKLQYFLQQEINGIIDLITDAETDINY